MILLRSFGCRRSSNQRMSYLPVDKRRKAFFQMLRQEGFAAHADKFIFPGNQHGKISSSPFPDMDAAVVADDESKLKSKPFNRALRSENGDVYDIIVGMFPVVGLTENDFGSLSRIETNRSPEVF